MSSRDPATSVKLDETSRKQLRELARRRHRSVHSMMKEAIQFWLERELAEMWRRYVGPGLPVTDGEREAMARTKPARKKGLPEHVIAQIEHGNNRLRVLRGWRGMTRAQLVKALADLGAQVSEKVLEDIEEERLRPGPGLWGSLAKALDVTVEDLLG
jgi:DNA-binding XRE family transcriptional regulator